MNAVMMANLLRLLAALASCMLSSHLQLGVVKVMLMPRAPPSSNKPQMTHNVVE